MTDASKPSRVSRRSLLAGLATMPTLFVGAGFRASQTAPDDPAAQEVQAALKNARGAKLIILGSGGGPGATIPGRTRHMTAHVMVSNGSAYVLDCGLGVTNQFARTRPVHHCPLNLHHPPSSRPQHRVRSLPPYRLGARPASLGARLWPAAAQADD